MDWKSGVGLLIHLHDGEWAAPLPDTDGEAMRVHESIMPSRHFSHIGTIYRFMTVMMAS